MMMLNFGTKNSWGPVFIWVYRGVILVIFYEKVFLCIVWSNPYILNMLHITNIGIYSKSYDLDPFFLEYHCMVNAAYDACKNIITLLVLLSITQSFNTAMPRIFNVLTQFTQRADIELYRGSDPIRLGFVIIIVSSFIAGNSIFIWKVLLFCGINLSKYYFVDNLNVKDVPKSIKSL